MTEFSRLSLWGLVSLSLGVTTACRNETPAFTEQDIAAIAVSVAEGGYEDEDRDNLFSIEDEASSETEDDDSDDADEGNPSHQGKGRSNSYAGSLDDDEGSPPNRHNADQEAEPSSSSAPSPSSGYGISRDDSKSIAKACSQHFKGMASKIVVLSAGDSISSISLSPQTVLAIRMTGNQPRMNLALAAGQPLAGLCIVLRGHEPLLQLSSGATVKKMVYLASGDQSQGDIQFSNGIEASHIDLSGHAPQLNLRGADANVCDSARLRNQSASIRCTP